MRVTLCDLNSQCSVVQLLHSRRSAHTLCTCCSHLNACVRYKPGLTCAYAVYNAVADRCCQHYTSHHRALNMARNVRNQLAGELSRAGIAAATTSSSTSSSSNSSSSSSSRNSKLQRALCAGFFMNGAQQCSSYGVYRAVSMPGLEVNKATKTPMFSIHYTLLYMLEQLLSSLQFPVIIVSLVLFMLLTLREYYTS
jgi:hypothetical protein